MTAAYHQPPSNYLTLRLDYRETQQKGNTYILPKEFLTSREQFTVGVFKDYL